LPRMPPCRYVSSRVSSTSSCTAGHHQVLEDNHRAPPGTSNCEPGRVPRFVSPPGAPSPGCLPQDQLPVSVSVYVQFRQKQKQLRGNLNITYSFLFCSNPISSPIGLFLVRLHQILCSNSIWGKASPFYFVPPCPDRWPCHVCDSDWDSLQCKISLPCLHHQRPISTCSVPLISRCG
jgi:hypothetical protein